MQCLAYWHGAPLSLNALWFTLFPSTLTLAALRTGLPVLKRNQRSCTPVSLCWVTLLDTAAQVTVLPTPVGGWGEASTQIQWMEFGQGSQWQKCDLVGWGIWGNSMYCCCFFYICMYFFISNVPRGFSQLCKRAACREMLMRHTILVTHLSSSFIENFSKLRSLTMGSSLLDPEGPFKVSDSLLFWNQLKACYWAIGQVKHLTHRSFVTPFLGWVNWDSVTTMVVKPQ